ncbi:nuclear transport factor 2 family protein [Zeaxanthinibacter enoshimensis]|uniref:Lumazine-binding protein n=1 Tax=Zeaxanthinibacter enoshimensis TaxID=392009 RepID=A0A4R6TNR5_9FLAO|nr:nuclear transport factor 2 family protein [Zeaxanthinibacter enoshimensis]TDQ31578.1 hypothetical protein CLV82_2286 [Zeaxanthinibacter enoshimensis]
MRTLLLTLSCFLLGCAVYSQPAADDPRNTIKEFFKAFHARDTSGMGALMAEGMKLQTMKVSDSAQFEVAEQTRRNFLAGMKQLPDTLRIEERIKSYDLKVDGPMAQVWTPYEFYVNGKFSHCGVNAFQLGKVKGRWKILYLIDTRRKTDCP